MIRLGTRDDPPWLDLVSGPRVRLRDDPAAERAAQLVYQQRRKEGAAEPDADAAGWVVRARRRIDAWENVLGPDDEPLPCTPEHVERLMTVAGGVFLESFRNEYLLHFAAWTQEGNGSASSQNGTSATAPPTASPAATREPRAPATSPGAAATPSSGP